MLTPALRWIAKSLGQYVAARYAQIRPLTDTHAFGGMADVDVDGGGLLAG